MVWGGWRTNMDFLSLTVCLRARKSPCDLIRCLLLLLACSPFVFAIAFRLAAMCFFSFHRPGLFFYACDSMASSLRGFSVYLCSPFSRRVAFRLRVHLVSDAQSVARVDGCDAHCTLLSLLRVAQSARDARRKRKRYGDSEARTVSAGATRRFPRDG